MTKKHTVVVVGGGFGGVKTALNLARDPRFRVQLISNSADFRYYPTLYHTATGGSRANSSIPLRTIFAELPIELIEADISKLDRKARQVSDDKGDVYSYDSLVLALGQVTNYFNISGLAEYSYGIKTQTEAARLKRHLHEQLINDHRPDYHYAIVGAGPTGIELAGALPGYLERLIKNHHLKNKSYHIDLIEAAPRLLPNSAKAVSKGVGKRLRSLGIHVYTKAAVKGETADELMVGERPIRSHSVIWTAGVTNHPFFKANQLVTVGRGKVAVNVYLEAEPNIYVIGDNANTPYSGMAQTALHDGNFVADNLKRKLNDQNLKSYVAKKPISVIPAGPHWAAVEWGPLSFIGVSGWLLRELADLRGFGELEPWPKAIRQYLSEFNDQDDCVVCATAGLN